MHDAALQSTMISNSYLASLGEELAHVAKLLTRVSQKLQHVSTSPTVPTVRVSKKTDPDMFTPEFLKAVRQSRKDYKEGRYTDYQTFRKSLNLE